MTEGVLDVNDEQGSFARVDLEVHLAPSLSWLLVTALRQIHLSEGRAAPQADLISWAGQSKRLAQTDLALRQAALLPSLPRPP
jgi:hypothetical protein